jgi:hypothetical protein
MPSQINFSASVTSKNTAVKPGGEASAVVTVTNTGNVTAAGKLPIWLAFASDGSTIPAYTVYTPSVRLQPGAHEVFRLALQVPVGFAPGSYSLVAMVDPQNTFNESNAAGNTATSATSLIVPDPYPVLGAYSGTVSTSRGPDKGAIVSQLWTVTAEDQTSGAISFTFTNTYANGTTSSGSGTGTVTSNGTITGMYPASQTTFKGRLIGKSFKGTHTSANGDFGSFDLTLV